MTPEEYEREQQELQRLVNEYNNLVARRNRLVEEYNALVQELQYSLNATIDAINYASQVQKYVVPRLDYSAVHVEEVADLVTGVQAEIESLSAKYFIIKNISTASKKMTQLNNEYQRNFGLYNLLRRVALGYVVGIDNHIISNEKLRTTVEKNYLQNADYWISHCLMATMLWVSDEKEAAERAINKAMSIDPHKSSLYFLLINLHFGRSEAASKWFEYYIQDVDVSNIGDEIRILLQAYLYNICGEDAEFKTKMSTAFNELLESIKNNTANYDNVIKNRVLEFISAHVHKSTEEFIELQRTCSDYSTLIETLECAEKNAVFAREFEELYNDDSSAPKNMIERIRNVLYDLINTYDEAEMQIMRSMDYNDMILKAHGDLSAAQRMYNNKYRPEVPQTMGDLMVKLAIPSTNDEVDVRVRKFAVSFLCENIIAAFEAYKKYYNSKTRETHQVTIDSFKVTVDEKKPEAAKAELTECYKKNKNKFIRRDKKVKTLTICTWVFWILWAISTVVAGVLSSQPSSEEIAVVIAWVVFAVFFVLSVLFTVLLMLQRKKVGAIVLERMYKGLEALDAVIRAIADWRNKFTVADEQSAVLIDVLSRFLANENEEVVR